MENRILQENQAGEMPNKKDWPPRVGAPDNEVSQDWINLWEIAQEILKTRRRHA